MSTHKRRHSIVHVQTTQSSFEYTHYNLLGTEGISEEGGAYGDSCTEEKFTEPRLRW